MTTETIDKLFLELSQFTTARTKREIDAIAEAEYCKSQSIQLAAFACRLQHAREDVPEDVCKEAAELVKKWKLKEPK